MASALFRVVRLGRQCSSLRPLSGIPLVIRSSSSTPEVCEIDSVSSNKDVDKAKTVETLFKSMSASTPLSVNEATGIISALGRLVSRNETDPKLVINNAKFNRVCLVIDKNMATLSNSTLLSTLRTLLSFGVDSDDAFVRSLEMQVLWKLRKMSLKHLVLLLTFHVGHQQTELQQKVVSEVLSKLQQRWFEVSSSREIIALLRHSSYFRSDYIGKLEDRIIDLADKMSADDLQRIFVALSEQKLRATHMLRAVAFHISKHQQKLGVKQIASLVNAMNSLNFPDVILLQRLSEDLLGEVSGIDSPTIIAALLTAFGRLQWRHPALLEAITDWIVKNVSKCRVSDLVAYVLTIARVNFTPIDESVFANVLPRLSRKDIESDTIWLDVVWSLAMMQRVTMEHVNSVVSKSFHSKLIDFTGYQATLCRRKLLNIYAVAKLELGYTGTLINELASENVWLPQSNVDQVLSDSILDTLSNYVPKGKYLACNKLSTTAVFVDAEFVLDKAGKPLPLADYTTNFGETSSVKSLPDGAHRIALLIHEYRDFTLNSVVLCGPAELNARILQRSGYDVVQIPYLEYNIQAPTLMRLKSLQQKINETISNANKLLKS